MCRLIVLAASVGAVSAFNGAAVLPRSSKVAMRQASSLRMDETAAPAEVAVEEVVEAAAPAPAVEYAESLPFLVKRPQLKGFVGDVGFDPIGFSEILPMVGRCPTPLPLPPPPADRI